MHTILVIGGYGFFGQRIAAALIASPGIRVLISGRNLDKARSACSQLGLPVENALAIDATGSDAAQVLRDAGADTVIHTAGPFQAQDYAVARAAIAAGCNYVDLADGRAFVAGITALDAEAKARGVTVIGGASSVPALSSAVVDLYRGEFSRLDAIRLGIGSGARAPGIATVQGIFGYCGKPFRCLEDGVWVDAYGWLGLQHYRFAAPVGMRLMCSCDIPDLELFPQRYAPVKTVTFQAGFASAPGHLLVWLLAGMVKLGILRSLSPWAGPLNRVSRWIEPFVSARGGMFVELSGADHAGQPLQKRWNLLAGSNHGPYIPCGAAIALAHKFARAETMPHGAMPCLGLLTVEEYLAPLRALKLDVTEVPA